MTLFDVEHTRSLFQSFNFKGRLNRKRAILIGFLVCVPLSLINIALQKFLPAGKSVLTLSSVITLINLTFSFSIIAKRLHDLGRSGWRQCWWILWYLIGGLLIGVGNVIMKEEDKHAGAVIVLIGAAFIVVTFLRSIYVCYFKKGQPGTNRFGKNPLEN